MKGYYVSPFYAVVGAAIGVPLTHFIMFFIVPIGNIDLITSPLHPHVWPFLLGGAVAGGVVGALAGRQVLDMGRSILERLMRWIWE